MYHQLLFLLVFICTLFPYTIVGQNMESLTVKDGLSQSMIFDITKDKDGFMWFATKNGLNRYDGYNFKVFTNNPYDSTSLPSFDYIRELFIDSKNRLWINSVSLYDRNKEIFYNLNKSVEGLIEDKKGNFWCFKDTTIYQLKLLETKDKTMPQFQLEAKATSKGAILKLKSISDGSILVGTDRNGLFKFNPQNNQLTALLSDKVSILSIIEYPKGTIWVNDGKKIYQIQDKIVTPVKLTLNQQPFYFNHITRMIQNPITKKIWIRTVNSSTMYEISPLQSKLEYDLNKANKITLENPKIYPTCFYHEANRTLWIGTNGYGIRKVALQKKVFHHLAVGKSIRSNIALSKKGILNINYYGVEKEGEKERKKAVFIKKNGYPKMIEGSEGSMLQTKDGQLWLIENKDINTKGGNVDFLIEINENQKEQDRYHFGNIQLDRWNYNTFIEGKDGHLWLSNRGDLIKFDRKKKTFSLLKSRYTEIAPNGSLYLYQDNAGVFWNCTVDGLLKITIDATGKTIEQLYKNELARHSLSNNVVAAVHDDPIAPNQYLWVATKGGGLNKLNKKTGKFEHFTEKDGLPNNVVYSVLPDDDGNLWLSTNYGLSKFNPTTKTFINFVKADGLQDNEFNTRAFLRDEKTGILYFGGINGITAFHPKDVLPSSFKPNVYISQLKIHGELAEVGKSFEQRGQNPLTKAIEYTKKIRLPWYQNQITLEFTSLDFYNPKKNIYQYQLSSVDKNWVQTGTRRSVNYSNLATGTYTFRLKATNSDGRWNDEETVLTIVIYPPWYRTYWAYAIYTILLFLGIYKLYQDQVRRAKLRNELEFEQKEAARLAEIDKIKTNFFSNITHEFRTPLTLIIEPLRQALKDKKMAAATKSKVKLAERNSQRLLGLVNQLLDLSKLESKKMALELKRGDFLEFVAPIMDSFKELAKQKNIQFIYNQPNELPLFDFDKNKVEKILFNLISNAIKFTKNNGKVTVNIIENTQNQQLQIQVIDTGIGISEKEQPHIFDRFYQVDGSNTREHEGTGIGLALSKELAKVMNGSLTFNSKFGKGSTFEVFIPIVQTSTTADLEIQSKTYISQIVERIETPIFHQDTPQLDTRNTQPVVNPDATNIALIIEDNEELREFIKSSIEPQYQIIEAKNGQEGLELALKHIPNIIISDVMMPIMDGFELCKQVKTDVKTAHIPVILLTAKTAMDSVLKGLQYKADAYIRKPFNLEELLLRMKNLIEIRVLLQQKFARTLELTSFSTAPTIHTQPQVKPVFEDTNLSTFDQRFLIDLSNIVEQNLDNERFTIEYLAKAVTMSRSQLYRKIKALVNQSPSEFIRNIRLKAAKQLLEQRKGNITEVTFMVGFSSPNYFSTKFKEKYGVKPSEV